MQYGAMDIHVGVQICIKFYLSIDVQIIHKHKGMLMHLRSMYAQHKPGIEHFEIGSLWKKSGHIFMC